MARVAFRRLTSRNNDVKRIRTTKGVRARARAGLMNASNPDLVTVKKNASGNDQKSQCLFPLFLVKSSSKPFK